MNRRKFLQTSGVALAGAPLLHSLASGATTLTNLAGGPVDNRIGGMHFALELEGVIVGLLRSFVGGEPFGEVVEERSAGAGATPKHIANVRFAPMVIEVGSGMGQTFYNWVHESLGTRRVTRNGAILIADFDFNVKTRIEFSNALITEVGLPALDASAKEAAYLTVKFAPEYTRNKPGSGKAGLSASKAKNWLVSNFKLSIDGLEDACAFVNAVEPLVITRTVTTDAIGERRDPTLNLGPLKLPNLAFTIAEARAGSLLNWFDSFVVKGNNAANGEKMGTLSLLSNDLKTSLLDVKFSSLGIFKLTADKYEMNQEAIRRLRAEMYCEGMVINFLI